MKILAKLLYWKLCFPSCIEVIPTRLRVVSGPFRGMLYSIVACGSAHSAKLLGTYEKELHAIIDEIQAEQFDEIIDIGRRKAITLLVWHVPLQVLAGS